MKTDGRKQNNQTNNRFLRFCCLRILSFLVIFDDYEKNKYTAFGFESCPYGIQSTGPLDPYCPSLTVEMALHVITILLASLFLCPMSLLSHSGLPSSQAHRMQSPKRQALNRLFQYMTKPSEKVLSCRPFQRGGGCDKHQTAQFSVADSSLPPNTLNIS